METYRVLTELGTNLFVDWATVMPEGEYFVIPTVTSPSRSFNSAAPLPLIYSDMFSASVHTTENPTIQPYSRQFICQAINRGYNTTSFENFNTTSRNRVPIFITNRPQNNTFYVKLIQSTTDGIFSSGFGNALSLGLQFIRYTMPLYKFKYSTSVPKPFNVLLNSVNGSKLAGNNNAINYNFNWLNHSQGNPNQRYELSFCFVTMGMNMTNNQPIQVVADFFNNANNYNIPIQGGSFGNSNFLLVGAPSSFSTLVNVVGGMNINNPIVTTLPFNNNFNVYLYELNSTVLFNPTTGSTQNYLLQLHFNPIV